MDKICNSWYLMFFFEISELVLSFKLLIPIDYGFNDLLEYAFYWSFERPHHLTTYIDKLLMNRSRAHAYRARGASRPGAEAMELNRTHDTSHPPPHPPYCQARAVLPEEY